MPYQFDDFDLRNILDIMPHPCLIVNIDTSMVEVGNYLLSEVTGFSFDEIKNVSLGNILNEFDLHSVIDGGTGLSQLFRKTDELLPVVLTYKFVGKPGNLLLLSIEKQDHGSDSMIEEITRQLIRIIPDLTNCSKKDLFKKVLAVLTANHFADEIGIYLSIEVETPFLKRVMTDHESVLPDEIPSIEIERIVELDVWQPGRRVLSEIHRAGRENKIQVIYSIPILTKNKPNGIAVFGYRQETQNEEREKSILFLVELISILIDSAISFSTLLEEKEHLSSELDKFSTAFENTSDGIVIVDDDLTIVDFNSSFPELLNYSPIEIKNKSIHRVFGKSESEEIIKVLEEQVGIESVNPMTLIDRNGNPRQFSLIGIPIAEGTSKKKLLIFQDQTQKGKLYKALEHMEKQAALGETISEFAHDARNIINRQSTGIQLLAKKLNITVERKEDISSLLEDCENLSDLMESVLSYSRQDVNEFEVIELGGFIQKVLYRNKYKAEKAGVEINYNNRFPEAKILGDQRSLERVLLNLTNNAIDAIKNDSGLVSITQMVEESMPGMVVIKIADTGPGIPENLTNLLLTSQYSDKAGGTGLGLLIANKIVEAHRGRIRLDSFAGGTIFSVYLPLLEQGEEN